MYPWSARASLNRPTPRAGVDEGLQVTTEATTASWVAFSRDLVARSLKAAGPVELVTSDAHAGLIEAIGTTLPGAAWQRCRTHWTCEEPPSSAPPAGSGRA